MPQRMSRRARPWSNATRAAAVLLSAAVPPALAALSGCGAGRADPAPEPEPGGESVVRRGRLTSVSLLTGELRAVEATNVVVPRTPIWRLPIRWMIADGSVVAEGQRILELDNSQFAGDLEQKRLAESKTLNELAQKEAEVVVQMADREFAVERARIELERARIEASVPEELRARRDHQEAQLELEKARLAKVKADEDLAAYRRSSRAELDVLRIELRKARREIETAERAIAALTLHAPGDGLVVVEENWGESRKLQVGDNVWVGMTVMRMPDLSAMKVDARLSDVDDGAIAVGARAICTLDAYPKLEFTGIVTEISPIAQEYDRRSLRRAFRVTILLDRADPERMRPGMSVRAKVLGEDLDDVLLVPRSALDFSTDPPRARLVGGGEVEVEVEVCGTLECAIGAGLEEGDRLEAAG